MARRQAVFDFPKLLAEERSPMGDPGFQVLSRFRAVVVKVKL